MEEVKESYLPKEYVDPERVLYVLQVRKPATGQWIDEGLAIRGRSAAYRVRISRSTEDGTEFRVIPKNEADRYREGWNAHAAYAAGKV